MGQADQRVRRIKQYVLARLREELGHAPRGAQARLAQQLGVSGAHLSNMLSPTPSRQPGEDFRRKVATHWGITYAQLEAIALGEELPTTNNRSRRDDVPPNLATAAGEYAWMHELPASLRMVVRDQARQYYAHSRQDFTCEEWQRILTGLEREALALVAHREQAVEDQEAAARLPRKRRPRGR